MLDADGGCDSAVTARIQNLLGKFVYSCSLYQKVIYVKQVHS